MKITFLGTGTSQGVPVIACECDVCQSKDTRDKRLRSSILMQTDQTSLVIDTGPDFRQQMLTNNVKRLDAVVFTHGHKDHIAGMDDIRAFNFSQNRDMDIYADDLVEESLKREFHYIFAEFQYPGIPKVNMNKIDLSPFTVGDIDLQPIEVMHYKLPVKAFRSGDFAYITDANYIDPEEMEKLKGVKTLVINALRREEHISHFTLDQALDIIQDLKVERAYLTHISHLLGKHEDVSKELPSHVFLAYDGIEIEVN